MPAVREDPLPEPDVAVVPLLSFAGGPNETHVSGSPAATKRTSARTEAAPTNRPGTGGVGQLERRITHHVRSGAAKDQPGTESAVGEDEDSEAEAHDVSSGAEEDSGGAAGKVGEGEEGLVPRYSYTGATFAACLPRRKE